LKKISISEKKSPRCFRIENVSIKDRYGLRNFKKKKEKNTKTDESSVMINLTRYIAQYMHLKLLARFTSSQAEPKRTENCNAD